MDARAQAVQENARIEEMMIVAAATGRNDFGGLANALGEQTAPEAVAPETDPQTSTQYFHLATPRERTPRRGKALEQDTKMNRGEKCSCSRSGR